MKTHITNIVIILTYCMMITGCYTEQKANRQIIKAQTYHPDIVAKHCSSIFPANEFSVDSFVFIQGNTVLTTDTIIVKDTVQKVLFKTITQLHQKTDTVFRLRNLSVVNRAKEYSLIAENNKLSVSLAKEERENSILFWVVMVLGVYTLLRWVVRFWGIKLP